jgi:transcriptional regulator with XRE-family HTH domain
VTDLAVVELYTRIGRNVATVRERRGTRQAELADAVGMSRSSIANTEQGRQRISAHTLVALAQALGVEVADLLGPEAPRPVAGVAGSERLLRRLVSARAQLDTVIANLEGTEAP